MQFDGAWRVTIATPLGKMTADLEIVTAGGVVRGRATQEDECVPFIDPVVDGDQLRWSQRVTKPLRLTLQFAVRIEEGRMTGTVRAGKLPASTLRGERIAATGVSGAVMRP